jgi:gliding motility-associated protein GldL
MSSEQKGSFKDVFFNKIMPMIYGFGAAIVIVGAMFKIMHWPGAGPMLVVGLSTEALIFMFSAFQPVPHDPDWSKVYPQLKDDYMDEEDEDEVPTSFNLTKKLDDMMSNAGIGEEAINKLGTGLNKLTTTVEGMSSVGEATIATQEYATNVKQASQSLVQMNKAYGDTVDAMSSMASASIDAKEYHNQVQNITKNLGALNAVYEMELQDANSHLKAMNKFYGNLSAAMDNMTEATKDSEQFKEELLKLAKNLNNLNTVYGNMLSAMKA